MGYMDTREAVCLLFIALCVVTLLGLLRLYDCLKKHVTNEANVIKFQISKMGVKPAPQPLDGHAQKKKADTHG